MKADGGKAEECMSTGRTKGSRLNGTAGPCFLMVGAEREDARARACAGDGAGED